MVPTMRPSAKTSIFAPTRCGVEPRCAGFDRAIVAILETHQNEDGSWTSGPEQEYGRVYATAVNALVLSMPSQVWAIDAATVLTEPGRHAGEISGIEATLYFINHVLTNYETTWYPSTHAAYDIVHREALVGPLRKIVVHDGHPGPKEIGVPPEFLAWLTDPAENGGGALMDFGCYGANLITWLMRGAVPTSVSELSQRCCITE